MVKVSEVYLTGGNGRRGLIGRPVTPMQGRYRGGGPEKSNEPNIFHSRARERTANLNNPSFTLFLSRPTSDINDFPALIVHPIRNMISSQECIIVVGKRCPSIKVNVFVHSGLLPGERGREG